MSKPESTIPVPPVQVTVVGTSVATPPGASPLTTGTVAVTPDHQPNAIFNVIQPIVAVVVRFLWTFFLSLSGSLSGAGVSGQNIIVWHNFEELLYKSCVLALSIAIVSMVKDISTLFTELAAKYPLMTGNV